MKPILIGLSLPLALACIASATAAPEAVIPAHRSEHVQPSQPRLVVLLTIDQFRADYLERFGDQLNGGLARLARGGAVFTNAHHDHAITETAPGHATLLSGRFPRSTGIMMNAIGVEDEKAPLVAGGYGPGASPARFRGTTLVDWMTAADRRSRTLSVSMKDRGAILPFGRAKTDVYWYSIDGRFLTSTYYRKALPTWVNDFNNRQLVAGYAGRTWTPLLPDSAYAEPDSIPIERGGRGFVFPHQLTDDVIEAGANIRIFPFIDDMVLAFGLHGLEALRLGTGPQTDLLALSLSATDVIGHNFGPDSREMHDQVLRVDRAIGAFLDSLYTLRDSASVTVVLTADHGVGTIPELAPAQVQPPPQRVSLAPILPALRARLRALKVDTFAIDTDVNIVLADRRAFRRPSDFEATMDFFLDQIRSVPGVARADRFRALLADTATDEIARRWAHQFPAESNVEAVITLSPLSTWGGNIASHGSPRDYDSHVPLIFAGFGVTPGRHPQFVRTVDLAPTLAQLLGVKPQEPTDGVALPINRAP